MKQPTHLSKDLIDQVRFFMNQKMEITKIVSSLDNSEYNAEVISQAIAFIKKQKHEQDFNNGIILLITGVLILLGSCIVTIYLFHINIFVNFFMYLSSGAGITICLLDFRKIFG